MNDSEYVIADAFSRAGWHVLRNGWPDFLMFNEDGRVRFVEVKSTCKQKMSPAQVKVTQVLSLLGIEVELIPVICTCRTGNCLQPVTD